MQNIFKRLLTTILLASSVCLVADCSPAIADELGIEYQPYRVRVVVAFGTDHRLTPKVRRRILSELSAAIDRSTAGQWSFEVDQAETTAPASRIGLERIQAEQFKIEADDPEVPAPEPEFDKQFFLTVAASGAKYNLAGKEWDESTQQMSPVVVRETYHSRAVGEELFEIVSETFHPLFSVEDVDVPRKFVSLRLKAGGFVPLEATKDPDAELLRTQIRVGSLLETYFRYHNKNGSVRQVQFIPWTYLVVDRIERGRVEASLVSGIRPPLGARTSKRVHSLAVAKRPKFPATELQIQLRSNPRMKLAGHYIGATAEKYPDEETESPEIFEGVTDRLGRLKIPVMQEHDIVWLRVKSGNTLLSLVPIAPGLLPKILLDLPDDSARLAAEGDLTQIRARLVDTVARRAALMVRVRKAAGKKDWKAVDEELANLEKLPSLQEFEEEINDIRTLRTNDTEQFISNLTKGRIRRMCDTAIELARKYLSEERIDKLKEEVREARNNNS